MNIINLEHEQEAISAITNWLQLHVRRPVLLLASGGSAAPVMAHAWQALTVKERSNITLSLADERYVPVSNHNSNWEVLRNLGINPKPTNALPVLRNTDIVSSVQLWEQKIETFISNDIPIIALLGIGTDAHIAGIKPLSPAATENTKLISSYVWNDFTRITITPALLKILTSAVVYTRGPSKCKAVEQLNQTVNPIEFPSQFLKQIQDCTILYVSKS